MSQPARLASPRPGTTTQVETRDAQPPIDDIQRPQVTGMLRLRGHRTEHDTQARNGTSGERRIRWAEDVVDNEGQGKKSSKVCCIYHKPRAVGESSSEESSSDSSSDESDSDSDVDNGEARMANGSRRYRPHGRHGHGHDHDQPGSDQDSQQPGPARKKKRSRPKPNAYERMPRYSKKPHN